ncbi:MAG TPA: FtsL-like putative cell division protein [Fulvivirga sp.]|nr:FtsL-like putative cell division protein [Fulvivirga sp.]
MSENSYKSKDQKRGGSLFNRIDNLMHIDAAFENGIPVRYMPYVLFIAAMGIFYIGNSHYAERNVRKIDKLERQVEDLRADYTTLKANYMFAGKQSEVAKSVAKLGIKESLRPPEKVIVKSEH